MLQLIFLLLSASSWSTTLVSRYQFLNAGTLPKNIWLFGVSHSETKGRGFYADNGTRVSNTDYFSRELNYSHLLDEVNDPLERDLAQAAFTSYGRDNKEVAGRVINDVSVKQKSDAYILGRGMSDKSSLFIIFPVVTLETQFKSRFVASQSLNNLATELRNEGQLSRAQEILNKSESALRQRLEENGYNTNYPDKLTTLANVYINYRYQPLKGARYKIASDSFLVVPAGKKFNENDFVPMRINEEQFSLKQGITGEWTPDFSFAFLSSLYYHKRFAFTKSQRVPNNSVSPLSADIDPNTRVQYGDALGTSAQANYIHSESFSFYLGQTIEYKQQDKYSGNKFENKRYDYLAQNSRQELGTGYVGVNINTIPIFLAKKFLIPMDLNLQYSVANMGENTFKNRMIALNMMVFYQ